MKFIVLIGVSFLVGIIVTRLVCGSALKISIKGSRKLKEFYYTLVYWVRLHQNHISIVDFFLSRNIKTIAIYGMKELGQLLYEELKDTAIEVKYAIDQNADHFFTDIPLYKPEDELQPVDMIVITVLSNNKSIFENLSSRSEAQLITVKNVIFSFKVD